MLKRFAATAALALVVAACAGKARDPVRQTVDGVVAAAEKRDAEGVASFLAETFHDVEGRSKADAADTVRRALAGYENLSLTISNLTIERNGTVGQAIFTLRMSGKPRSVRGLEGFLPRTSRWSFELRMESTAAGWKITNAAWRELDGG